MRIPPNSFSQARRRIGPVPLRPPFVASSYLFFKQSLPLIFSLNNLSLSPTGCPTHSPNEVSPAPPSPSSSAPYQTHSQNCLLIVQLDNCHLSLLLLSVSHKELNGFGRRGGGGSSAWRGPLALQGDKKGPSLFPARYHWLELNHCSLINGLIGLQTTAVPPDIVALTMKIGETEWVVWKEWERGEEGGRFGC